MLLDEWVCRCSSEMNKSKKREARSKKQEVRSTTQHTSYERDVRMSRFLFPMFALPLLLPVALQAQSVTFTKHVAPILQEKCQECHQPGSIAPMSLITYEDARKYARRIKTKVSARLMPPWHIDRTVGIQAFKNDRSLSDEQIATLVKWIDDGTPLGSSAGLPPALKFPDPNRRSEEHTSELQSQSNLVCRLLLEK